GWLTTRHIQPESTIAAGAASKTVISREPRRRPRSASAIGSATSSVRHPPDLHGVVAAAGRQPLAVGAEGHAVADGVSAAAVAEFQQFAAAAGVPHPADPVRSVGCGTLAVGAEGHAPHRIHMPGEGRDLLAGVRVPDLGAVILTGGG